MVGKIVNRNGTLYVLYESNDDSEPKRTFLFWRIEQLIRSPYGHERPSEGDAVKYTSSNSWTATDAGGRTTGTVHTAAGQADRIETVSVNPPKVRAGIELRWHRGHWQKLLKKGWVAA